MIDFSKINNGIDKISMPAHKEMYIESDENTSDISQHELMNAIHQEFKRSFILKLYPHLEWTDRIFWNVAGIARLEQNGVLFDHTTYFAGINYNLPQ